MDVDLTALGLSPLAARVLALVAEESCTTSVALAARLHVARSQVCVALEQLGERGLVHRMRGRRPAPVRLADDLGVTVDATLAELDRRRRDEADRAQSAADHLRAAAARARSRPQPMAHLDPRGPAHDAARRGARTHYDEVCRADGPTMLYGAPLASRTRIERRILVLGEPSAERARWMRRRGVPLRCTAQPLPMLVVVDRSRAQVEVTADGRASATGWTCDAAQVAALLRLFDLWWEEAGR